MGVSDEGSRVGVVVGGRATEIKSSETPSDHTTLTKRGCREQTTKPQPHPTSPLGSGGGLEAVLVKLLLSLPSPRASDPVGLDRSRANIDFAKPFPNW